MKSEDISTLQQLVNAANGWRDTALTVGVEINIITSDIRGQTVILSWDNTNTTWDIRTGTSA